MRHWIRPTGQTGRFPLLIAGQPFPLVPFVGIVVFLLAPNAGARVLDFRVVERETSAPIDHLPLDIHLNEKSMTGNTDKAGRFEIELPEDGVAFFTIGTGVPSADAAGPARYRLREFAIRLTRDGRDEQVRVARARNFLRGLAADVRTEKDFRRLGKAREPEGFKVTLRGEDKWVEADYRGFDFAAQLAALEPDRTAGPFRDGDEFFLVWLLEKPAVANDFVPMRVAFARPWWPAERNRIPKRFTLALQRGTAIGGVVRDQAGKPLGGATVYLTVPFPDAPDSRVLPSIDKLPLTTDVAGRWRFGGMPFHIDWLFLRADHPEYGPQTVGRIDDLDQIARLRDLRHEIVLEKTPVLRGAVLDEDGNPIKGALVSYAFGGRRTATGRAITDGDGQFRITELSGYGTYHLAAQAPGYAPQMRQVELGPNSAPLSFRLGAGKRFKARVVDENGRPVPDVHVASGPWQGLFLGRWEAMTDRKGRFQMEGLPAGGLPILLWKQGYVRTERVALPGDAGDITLQTVRILRISGRVVDEETGRPISAFTLVKSGTHEDGRGMVGWTHRQGFLQGGRYEAEFDFNASAYLLRVDAPGYLTYISPVFTANDGSVVHDIKLRSASRVPEIERTTEPANRRVDEVFEVDEFTAALWRFNNTGGRNVLVDSSRNRNDGTIRGAEWVHGFRGNGLYFNGIRDVVIVPGSRSLNIRDHITIEALVKYSYESRHVLQRGGNLTQGIVDRGPGLPGHGGYYVRLAYRRPDFAVSMPYVETYTTAVLQPEKWHYVAAVYNNRTVRIYIDGKLTRARDLGRGNLREWEDQSYLFIGCEGGGNFFNGVLDEIRISNTSRTAEEIERNWMLMTDPKAARRASAPPAAETHRFEIDVVERGTDKRVGAVSLIIETTTGTIEAATNSSGRAVLELSAAMKYVAVVARKRGFVPVRAKLMQPGMSEERTVDTLIRQTLEMPRAMTIGGRVGGGDGKGREGMRLSISFPPDGDDLAGRVYVENAETTTKADGSWVCGLTPETADSVRILVKVEDQTVKELNITAPSEIERLRDRTHVIVLRDDQ